MDNEKRLHKRSPIELAASYGIEEDSLSKEAGIVNVSTGGFCFYSKDDLPVDKKLQLVVDISPNDQITLNVQIAWTKEYPDLDNYMIGVKILDTKGDDYKKFLDFHAGRVL